MNKITFGWQKIKHGIVVSEGGYTLLRRLFGRMFLGEKFTRIRSPNDK